MQDKYNVVLSGRNPAVDPQLVTQKLASLFKCSEEQAGQLLAQPSWVVKKDVGAEMADKYKKAIENTGAQCVIQFIPQEPQLEFDVAPVGVIPKKPSTPPVLLHEIEQEADDALDAPASGLQAAPSIHPAQTPAVAPPTVQDRSISSTGLSRQEAIEIFVGKNHSYFTQQWESASKKKNQLSWNWAAFLVGFGWMAYRKMYRYSWIFIGVVVAELIAELVIGVPSSITSSINLGIAIGFGLKGNVWYQQHVNARIDQILATHTAGEARTELARAGGTNIGAAIGFVVALFVLLAMIGVIAEA